MKLSWDPNQAVKRSDPTLLAHLLNNRWGNWSRIRRLDAKKSSYTSIRSKWKPENGRLKKQLEFPTKKSTIYFEIFVVRFENDATIAFWQNRSKSHHNIDWFFVFSAKIWNNSKLHLKIRNRQVIITNHIWQHLNNFDHQDVQNCSRRCQ